MALSDRQGQYLFMMSPQHLPSVLPMMETFNHHELIPWREAEMRASLERLVADPALGLARVIYSDDELAGYVLVTFGYDIEFGGRDAFVTELFISAALRGRRVADQALALVEQEAARAGVHALHLQVRPDNAAARALYERRGFTQIPRLLLSKSLAPSR